MSRGEEDDLDDLDDLLDEFAAQVLSKPPGADLDNSDEKNIVSANTTDKATQVNDTTATTINTTTSTTTSKTTVTSNTSTSNHHLPTTNDSSADPSIPELDEQFAKEFKLGVDNLLSDLQDSPEAQQSFEALIQGMLGSTGATPQTSASKTSTTSNDPQKFQDTISQTMNKLKESHSDMNEKSKQSSEEDFLLNMMKELENATGSNNSSDLDGLLGEMLKELSSKSILYEPMKEMDDKFPDWLKEHASTITAEEKTRYENQQRIVNDIVTKFEDSKYSDDDEQCRKYIGEKMEEMQKSGAPPPELMGDLASGSIPGLDLTAPDGGLNPDEGCPVQ